MIVHHFIYGYSMADHAWVYMVPMALLCRIVLLIKVNFVKYTN